MGLESLSHQPALGPGGKLGDDGVLKRVSQKSFWLPMLLCLLSLEVVYILLSTFLGNM